MANVDDGRGGLDGVTETEACDGFVRSVALNTEGQELKMGRNVK